MPESLSAKRTRLNALASYIQNAFNDATNELGSSGAPYSVYMEIYWDGGKIRRLYDNEIVLSLQLSEQKRLYYMLDGLFKKAFENLNLP